MYQPIRTGTDQYKSVRAGTSGYGPVQADTDGTSRYRPIQNPERNKSVPIPLSYRNGMYTVTTGIDTKLITLSSTALMGLVPYLKFIFLNYYQKGTITLRQKTVINSECCRYHLPISKLDYNWG